MNWIFKNKKMPCEKSTSEFFCKLKNILCSKRTKTILVVLFLVCIVYVFLPHSVLGADGLNGATATAATGKTEDSGSGLAKTISYYLVGKPLEGVQNFMIVILTGAVAILETMLNPDAMSGDSGLLNSKVVKDIWVMTRDTMNMFFILILLFSAFCTIFQVEKWNLKKVWLAILINALLVNFSFPIARFFIDVSNVAMYYFLNNMFTGATSGTTASGSSIAASFGTYSNLSGIFKPENFASEPIFFELAIIIFTFIFAITLLVLAILFVIRLIALGLIVMFSPIGFVGFIFPDTQKFASDWWSNLFKYAFFGPIMVFMMSVALQISSVMSSKTAFTSAAVKNVGSVGGAVNSSYIVQIATFAIPIIILWMAMGISKKMGIAGADMVVGKAEGFAKWAGKKVAMMGPGNWAKKNWEQFSKQRKARQDEKDKNRIGSTLGKKLNYAQDRFSPFESSRKRAEKMRQDENKEGIEKGAKSLVDGGANVETLSRDLNRHFATTATTKDEKIKHAQHAAAYLKQDNDEKKQHIIDHLEATRSLAGSDFENIIGSGAGLTGREKRMHDEVVNSANEIAAGNSNEEHVRRVAAHVNKKMREKMEEGAKAT